MGDKISPDAVQILQRLGQIRKQILDLIQPRSCHLEMLWSTLSCRLCYRLGQALQTISHPHLSFLPTRRSSVRP